MASVKGKGNRSGSKDGKVKPTEAGLEPSTVGLLAAGLGITGAGLKGIAALPVISALFGQDSEEAKKAAADTRRKADKRANGIEGSETVGGTIERLTNSIFESMSGKPFSFSLSDEKLKKEQQKTAVQLILSNAVVNEVQGPSAGRSMSDKDQKNSQSAKSKSGTK